MSQFAIATKPKVSICIPSYNASKTLPFTLDSILKQTYQNIEILIVDNASTDNTVEIVKEYQKKDNRIKLYHFDVNIGGEGNFSRCIELTSGDYTAIYHADDVYMETIVEKEIDFMERHKSVGVTFTPAVFIDEDGKIIKTQKMPREINTRGNLIYNFEQIFKIILKNGNFLICPSAMVRTDIYKNIIKKWNGEKFGTSADLDVWLRIAEFSNIAVLKEPLMYYRLSKKQGTYMYNKTRIKRADFFIVVDHYLTRKDLLKEITQNDLLNYELLECRDKVQCALNAVLLNKYQEAKKIIKEVFSWQVFFASFREFYSIIYFLFSFVILVSCNRISAYFLKPILLGGAKKLNRV